MARLLSSLQLRHGPAKRDVPQAVPLHKFEKPRAGSGPPALALPGHPRVTWRAGPEDAGPTLAREKNKSRLSTFGLRPPQTNQAHKEERRPEAGRRAFSGKSVPTVAGQGRLCEFDVVQVLTKRFEDSFLLTRWYT